MSSFDNGLMLTEAYRPYYLADMIGQERHKKVIGAWLRTNRVPRSILIGGPFSCGKTTLARIVARAALCQNPEKGNACASCKACLAFDNKSHPDYLEMNSASDRGIDAMRRLSEKVQMGPLLGKKKIVVLDEAHGITGAGYGALLKPMEEPPKHLIFILVTTNPEKIPRPNVSRCSQIMLQGVSVEECTELLMEVSKKKGLGKAGITTDHLTKVAKATGAHPRNALHALEQVYTMTLDATDAGQSVDAALISSFIQDIAVQDNETLAANIVRGVLEGKPGGALKRAEGTSSADQLLTKVTEMLRQAMMLSTNPKLMDQYYKDVFDGCSIFEYTAAKHPLHLDARQVILDSYSCFTNLLILTSNHATPVHEVIGEPIARSSLICQKFLKANRPIKKTTKKREVTEAHVSN